MPDMPHKVPDSRLARFLMARRRLLLSLVAGIALVVLLPPSMRLATRYVLAWDLTSTIYVVFGFWMIARSNPETCHRRAALYDDGDWAIVLLVVAAAAASFVAIFTELATMHDMPVKPLSNLLIVGATVVLSWTFTHLIFTLHYANLYYRKVKGHPAGGLRFPGDRAPDYRDFLYYAFVIGCAAQTADVETESASMRLVSLLHGIVAFAFNTAILALAINIGAGLLS
jgi:uncharacterized membrane protein